MLAGGRVHSLSQVSSIGHRYSLARRLVIGAKVVLLRVPQKPSEQLDVNLKELRFQRALAFA